MRRLGIQFFLSSYQILREEENREGLGRLLLAILIYQRTYH